MSFNLARIDEFLASLEKAADDDELRKLFETYNAEYDLDVPKDPYSAEYRERQFQLYETLHGKPYATSHEHSSFDVPSAARSPFPYFHGSWSTVGNQLIAIGFIIKAMELPKRSRILEFGPGWGNTTIALAKMGYDVTAVDIEPNFVELIKERARMEQLTNLRVSVGDFSSIESMEEPYDAILFFECFHHCSDHLRLIKALNKALKPGGIVCFGAEPIVPDFPLPWGLRMDGQSLWAIRKNGWLELGFNTTYFEETMRQNGWWLDRRIGHDSPWATALIARRIAEMTEEWTFLEGQLKSQVGTLTGTKIAADGRAGFLMHGPYVSRGRGKYVAAVHFDRSAPLVGNITFEVVARAGLEVLAQSAFSLDARPNSVSLEFTLDEITSELEMRIICESSTQATIDRASINYRDQ